MTFEVTAGPTTGVLTVPISTVEGRYQSGITYLPTSDPSRSEKHAVALGITDGRTVEVEEGLMEGEETPRFIPASNKNNQGDQAGPYDGMDSGMARGSSNSAGTQWASCTYGMLSAR